MGNPLNLCSTACFDNQRVMKNFAETWRKSGRIVWQICYKALILHPQSREMRTEVEILNEGQVLNFTALKKTFFKKTSKSFGSSKISLTFASAFETEAFEEEFFERFRYEQASSTILT